MSKSFSTRPSKLAIDEYFEVCNLLYEEAASIDEQRWADWLALYTDDAVFWVPSWDQEHQLTTDPLNDVSLIYIEGKETLSDRIWRFSSGDSPASTPLPRTSHIVGNITVTEFTESQTVVTSRWHCQVHRFKDTWSYAGRYEHRLQRNSKGLQISRKYVVLTNSVINTALDIYHV